VPTKPVALHEGSPAIKTQREKAAVEILRPAPSAGDRKRMKSSNHSRVVKPHNCEEIDH
jgi:hypothetical protein